MVNYKRVVCEVAVLAAMLAIACAAPHPDCTERHYDQRQNGTDNVRVNIDGVLIAVAPAESIAEVASEFTDLFDMSDIEEYLKPSSSSSSTTKPEAAEGGTKPEAEPQKPAESPLSDVTLTSETKSQKKDGSVGKQEKFQRLTHRLANVLIPLLRKTRHH